MFTEKNLKKVSIKKITKALNNYDELVNTYDKGFKFLGELVLTEYKLTLWLIGILFMLGLTWFIGDLITGDFILGGMWLVILLSYTYLFYDKFRFYNKLKGGLKWKI